MTAAQVFARSVPISDWRTDRVRHVAHPHDQNARFVERKFPLSAAARIHRRIHALDDLCRNVVA